RPDVAVGHGRHHSPGLLPHADRPDRLGTRATRAGGPARRDPPRECAGRTVGDTADRGGRVMVAVVIACSTHLGESLAFAAPPILLIGSLVGITVRARRRGEDSPS